MNTLNIYLPPVNTIGTGLIFISWLDHPTDMSVNRTGVNFVFLPPVITSVITPGIDNRPTDGGFTVWISGKYFGEADQSITNTLTTNSLILDIIAIHPALPQPCIIVNDTACYFVAQPGTGPVKLSVYSGKNPIVRSNQVDAFSYSPPLITSASVIDEKANQFVLNGRNLGITSQLCDIEVIFTMGTMTYDCDIMEGSTADLIFVECGGVEYGQYNIQVKVDGSITKFDYMYTQQPKISTATVYQLLENSYVYVDFSNYTLMTVTILSPPGNGILKNSLSSTDSIGVGTSLDSAIQFYYVPNKNFYGNDSMLVSIGTAYFQNKQTVLFQVQFVNQPPQVSSNAQTVNMLGDSTVNITLSAQDPEGSNLTYYLVSLPVRGNLFDIFNTSNSFISNVPYLLAGNFVQYTPILYDNGNPYSWFTWNVRDNMSLSMPNAVNVTINVQVCFIYIIDETLSHLILNKPFGKDEN